MTTDVRRVARAICKSRTCEGAACCQWPANMGRTRCPVDDGGYNDAARDAIAALLPDTPLGRLKASIAVKDAERGRPLTDTERLANLDAALDVEAAVAAECEACIQAIRDAWMATPNERTNSAITSFQRNGYGPGVSFAISVLRARKVRVTVQP